MSQRLLIVTSSLVCLFGAAGGAVPVAAAQAPAGLRPMAPIRCAGTEHLEIQGRYIAADGNAIEARENCVITMHDSQIEAGGTGLLVQGDSVVTIRDSRIDAGGVGLLVQGDSVVDLGGSFVEGGAGGVVAANDTYVILTGTTVLGGVVTRGNARVEDKGGNQLDQAATAVPQDWRERRSSYSIEDTLRLLSELGATIEGGKLELQMAGDVLFDFGSSAIRPDAAVELAKVAHLIRQRSAGNVYVAGHTDSVGDEDRNQALSEQRAAAVKNWLVQQEGIPAQLIEARGYGETQPIAYNTMPDGSDNPAGRAQNRRVAISFSATETSGVAVQMEPRREAAELPEACARICRRWPSLDDLLRGCAVLSLSSQGYEALGRAGCIDVQTSSECTLCWRSLGVTGEVCQAVSRSCLGG